MNKTILRLFACLVLVWSAILTNGAEKRRKVTVGFNEIPGYHDISANGVRTGYGYEYLQQLTRYAQWDLLYVGFEISYQDITDMLAKGDIDLLTAMVKTPEREKIFDFSDMHNGVCHAIITVKAGNNKYDKQDFSTWKGMKIGVQKNTLHTEALLELIRKHNLELELIWFDNEPDCHNALMKGLIDAMNSVNYRQLENEWLLLSYAPRRTYFAVKKGNSELLDELNQAQAKLEYHKPLIQPELIEKYFSKAMITSPETDDAKFITKCKNEGRVFKALIDAGRHPLVYVKDGQIQGVQFEYIKKILESTGLDFEYIGTPELPSYLKIRETGEYDLILDYGSSLSLAEKEGLHLSEVYMRIPVSMLMRKYRERSSGIASAMKDSAMWDTLLQSDIDISTVISFTTPENMMDAILSGDVDFAYASTAICNRKIQEDRTGQFTSVLHPTLRNNYTIAVKRDLPRELISILDNAISSVSQERTNINYESLQAQPSAIFLFKDWLHLHIWKFIFLLIAILIGIICIFIWYVYTRRKENRFLYLMSKLPIRFFITDRNYKILFYTAPDIERNISEKRISIEELALEKGTQIEIIKEAVDKAFAEGLAAVNYQTSHSKRSALLTRIKNSVFKQEVVLWISQDTTELQNARIATEASRQNLNSTIEQLDNNVKFIHSILDFSPFSLVIKIKDGDDYRFFLVNKAAADFMNANEKEVIGKTDFDIPAMKNLAEKIYRQDSGVALSNFGEVHNWIEELPRKDSPSLFIKTYKKAFRGHKGDIFIISISVDMTEQEIQSRQLKKQQEVLEQAMFEAKSSSRAKNHFLAVMSHEIRTPLNAVIGLTELLRSGSFTKEEEADMLSSIGESANTLLHLMNDMLDLSRMDAGQMVIRKSPCSIERITGEIHAIFNNKAKSSGLDFKVSVQKNIPFLEVDANRIRQILLNLVGNAIKFTSAGSISLKTSFDPIFHSLTISVTDTGIGIRKENLANIFEPFKQEDENKGTRKYGGSGLGLSVSKKLAGLMGGSLNVESVHGSGSTFTLILNNVTVCKNISLNENSILDEQKQMQILIVDDLPVNAKLLSLLLKKTGANTVTAHSAGEALELMKEKHFDVLLTDLWMPPGDNGDTLTKAIKNIPGRDKTIIIAVTGDVDAAVNFDLSVFDALLLKPVTPEKLKKICAGLINFTPPR